MKRDIFKTLFSRMLAMYLAVTFSLLLLMGVTVSSMFRNQYIQEEEDALRRETEEINAILVEKYIYEEKRPVAIEDLLMVARKYDALVQVVSRQGGILSYYDHVKSEDKWGMVADSAKKQENDGGYTLVSLPGLEIRPDDGLTKRTGGNKEWTLQPKDQSSITEQGIFFNDLFKDYTDMATLTLVRSVVQENGQADGVILMHIDMRPVNASISQVYMDVLLIGFMAVAAAVLAVYYITSRMTKPIVDMNSAVRRYSKGAFELRLDDSGADEVAQLAKGFNMMADELSNLEQTRRSFVANVSHELRSPLTSISGFLEAIQDGTIPHEKHGEYLDIVMAEARRMTGMVNNLLDLARMESGQASLSPIIFDINELARRMLLTFEARINSKRLDVELDLMEPHCFVEADPDQIGHVLRNLIDNAIKFSPEGGVLRIATKLVDRRLVHVSVQDFGEGIPPEDVRNVFERFYKVEKAHTPSAQSGTGLGLSIVRVIIDQHGQDIWVKSKRGEGACFTFTLKYISETKRRLESKNLQEYKE